MSKLYKILLGVLIIANITLGIYAIATHQTTPVSNKVIPASELLEHKIITSHIKQLQTNSIDNQIAIALLTNTSTSCTTGKIVEVFRNTKKRVHNAKLRIILPNQYNTQDIENFKSNMDLNFEVIIADEELFKAWQPLADKYSASGVVIILDQEKYIVSQDIRDIAKHLSKFE